MGGTLAIAAHALSAPPERSGRRREQDDQRQPRQYAAMSIPREPGIDTCIICMEDNIKGIRMPCCGTEESDVLYWQRCLATIIEQANQDALQAGMRLPGGGVGSCPTCRRHFQFTAGEDGSPTVTNTVLTGNCRMCMQGGKVLVNGALCDKCYLGSEYCFTYECQRCNRFQRIPHPMFMYQPSVGEFGGNSWACHQRCGDYTKWRIRREEAEGIPPQHCPESWGRRDDWLAQIREIRQQQQRALEQG